jgi:hypothetical protein
MVMLFGKVEDSTVRYVSGFGRVSQGWHAGQHESDAVYRPEHHVRVYYFIQSIALDIILVCRYFGRYEDDAGDPDLHVQTDHATLSIATAYSS